MTFWYCLEHKSVEEGFGCGRSTRIGPYDTREQAAGALSRVHQREKEQEAKDADLEKKHGKKRDWF